MNDEVTQAELERMAEIDGENRFGPSDYDRDSVGHDFDAAMHFSLRVRDALALGHSEEEIPENWRQLVSEFDLGDSSREKKVSSQTFGERLAEIFARLLMPRVAWGGAFALALGVAFVIQVQNEAGIQEDRELDSVASFDGSLNEQPLEEDSLAPEDPLLEVIPADEGSASSDILQADDPWKYSYASLDVAQPLSSDASLGSMSKFTGDFFSLPRPVMRSDAPDVSAPGLIQELFDSESSDEVVARIDWEAFAPPLRGMVLNDKSFGRWDSDATSIWLSIRGEFVGSDGNGICHLAQVSEVASVSPDQSVRNVFLRYCPRNWSNKIEYLGFTLE